MGISLRTALIIHNHDVKIAPYQNTKTAKYGYEIYRLERGNYRPLLTSEATFTTEEEAQREGLGLAKRFKETPLDELLKDVEDPSLKELLINLSS